MRKNKKYMTALTLLICAMITFSGCSDSSGTGSDSSSNSESSGTVLASTSLSAIRVKYDIEDYYFDWKSQSYKTINLGSDSSEITQSGIYEIKGTLTEGSLTIDVDKSKDDGIVYLVLNGANITSSNSAPIYVKSAKKVVIILENGSENTVSQGSSVQVNDDNEPSAAIFSKSDLTITGGGKLSVTSDYNDGITSKDELKITDGTLVVKAKADGIVGKDLLAVEKGNVTVTAGKDGMRSTNDSESGMGNIVIEDGTFNITSENDGLQAFALLQIDGGAFNITSGGGYTSVTKGGMGGGQGGGMGGNGGMPPQQNQQATPQDQQALPQDQQQEASSTETDTESCKALKGTESIIISGGTFNISTSDDAIHSKGDVTISGGKFAVSSGDDGIHSDTNIKITAGTIDIKNSYEAIEAKNITIGGGDIDMVASDDGFNVNDESGTLTFNSGDVYVNAGGDGIDSNGKIVMTGGTVYVDGPQNDGNGPVDYNDSFEISGGIIVATGSSGMAQTTSSGTQPSVLMYYTTAQAAGTKITLKDSSGNIVAEYTPKKQYASAAISAPNLKVGTAYTLYSNDTKVVTFTPTENVTFLNEKGITTNQSRTPGGNMGNGGNMGDGQQRQRPDGNMRTKPSGTPPSNNSTSSQAQ